MAVYPAHGVGMIEGIEEREIGGQSTSFYVMRILDSSMVVMIPTATSKNVGLRKIIDTGEVKKIYSILKERRSVKSSTPWNQRYRKYMEKIRTGSPFEIAAVLRDLYLLQGDKELSFGERKMMDTARSLLIKEIALAKDTAEDAVAADMDKIFS